ncbi:MAG: ISAs1 family transposase [Kiritimatiellia bacterium]
MNENHVLFRLMLAVKEPRVARTRVYELPQILFCTVAAMLSGATTFNEMEFFVRMRRKWIERWIALPGIPSHDTFNRILQLIEPQALEAFLRRMAEWLGQVTGAPQRIAVDGKTLRGSQKAGKAIHLLNAWADNTRLVIGQCFVDGKSNEILAVPRLLESLFLDGCIVTVDALNTQTAIAKKIIDKGAE